MLIGHQSGLVLQAQYTNIYNPIKRIKSIIVVITLDDQKAVGQLDLVFFAAFTASISWCSLLWQLILRLRDEQFSILCDLRFKHSL